MPGRDNGFVARHYVALADLDPRLAEAMLDVLRAEGIAAYVEPSTGRIGGYLEVHLPNRPHDRLWVDRERQDRAATLLAEHTAAPALPASAPISADGALPADSEQPSFDDAWAQLVANYDLPSDDAAPRWPVSEDVPPPPWESSPYDADADTTSPGQETLPIEGLTSPDATPVRRRIVRPADRGAPASPSSGAQAAQPESGQPSVPGTPRPTGEYDPLSVLDEHYVPPTPPPTPALRPVTKVAISAIVVGFGLIVARTFSDTVPDGVALGVIGIVGGFVTLLVGMRQDRPSDSDSDDGAVV